MIGRFANFVLCVLTLVVGASLEEMLPHIFGVGFPILLAGVIFMSLRLGLMGAIIFAIAAGAFEDALSSLSPFTDVSFFILVMMFARACRIPFLVMVIAYPCYQIWLSIWVSGMGGDIFNRVLLSLPIGLIVVGVVGFILKWAEGKAAIHARG